MKNFAGFLGAMLALALIICLSLGDEYHEVLIGIGFLPAVLLVCLTWVMVTLFKQRNR